MVEKEDYAPKRCPMKRALLFPSYFGNGFGHIARCLTLADELTHRGWTAAMVLAGPHVGMVQQAGYQTFTPRFPTQPRSSKAESPAYICIPDGSLQVLRDGFVHPWRVWAAVTESLSIVRRFRPDVLIGDISLLPWIVGQLTSLPVVQVVRSMMHPATPRLIWWKDPPSGIVSPDIRPVFAGLLRHWNLKPIDRAEDLLRGDLFLIPSIPEIEPLPDNLPNTYYVGALVRELGSTSALPAPLDRQADQSVVYVTLGGGASSVGNYDFFLKLNEAMGGTPWSVIVSTGRKFDISKLPLAPPNLFYYQWVPGRETIQRSDVVVFHGGYGTTMETLQSGVPSIVLPFHTEQEANGRRLEANSVAQVLLPTTEPYQVMRRRWRGAEYTVLFQQHSKLSADTLRQAIATVLTDTRYRQNALHLSHELKRYGGPAQAVDLTEALLC